VGLALLWAWMMRLLPWLIVPFATIPALWIVCGGIFLRRLARGWPLALAVPAAWFLAEFLRWVLPAPLSFGWWRLGSFLHDLDWLAGSSRVWGTWGLTWIAAAFAGWLADLSGGGHRARARLGVHALGLGPLLLGLVLGAAVPAPATKPGPRLLLVQPGITQEIKVYSADPFRDLYLDAVRLTREGLAGADGAVDLVCWGETMLPFTLDEGGAYEAWGDGARPPDYSGKSLEAVDFRLAAGSIEALVGGALFGREGALDALRGYWRGRLAAAGVATPLLPPGTAFLSGVDTWVAHRGTIRRRNAAALWDREGRLAGVAAKSHLVPAAEAPGFWTEIGPLLRLMRAVGGYVPDFVAAERTGVLSLAGGERTWRFGASICYDNAFDDPFAAPAGDVDLHLVLSNEAWYEDSLEMDHMVAFTRLAAISSGRSVVRATNSGISGVMDPRGRFTGVVERGGERKMVRGTSLIAVPVPAEGRPRTVWVRTFRWQPWAWAGLALLCLVSGPRGRAGNRPREEG